MINLTTRYGFQPNQVCLSMENTQLGHNMYEVVKYVIQKMLPALFFISNAEIRARSQENGTISTEKTSLTGEAEAVGETCYNP